MVLIGLSGKKGVGKDLLGSYLVKNHDFIRLSFAEVLKEGVRRDFGLTKEHTDGILKEAALPQYPKHEYDLGNWTPRELMIEYGQFFRQFSPNFWIQQAERKLQSLPCFISNNDKYKIVVTDVRFENELEWIKNQGGTTVRLERFPDLNIYKEESNDISETALDNAEFDYKIIKEENIDPKDLETQAKLIVERINGN